MSILNNHDFAHMIANNPFLRSTTHPSVFVAHGDCPYTNARQAIASVDLTPASGRRVLLKPNVGRIASVGSGITTHPEVIAAAIDAFREAGAEVAIGESPILGVKVREAFATSGVASIADSRNCPLIDMDRRPAVKVPVPEGRVLHRLMVCPEVLGIRFCRVDPSDEDAHAHESHIGGQEHEGLSLAAKQGGVAHVATTGGKRR